MSKAGAGDDQQEQDRRPRRWTWIAVGLVLLGAAAAFYAAQRLAPLREAESLPAVVKAMGGRNAEADRDFAARMAAQQRDSPLRDFCRPSQRARGRARRAGAGTPAHPAASPETTPLTSGTGPDRCNALIRECRKVIRVLPGRLGGPV